MTREERLQKRKHQRIFYLLFRGGLAIRTIVDLLGQGDGITLSQYTLLSLVEGRGNLTTASLARSLEISPQSVHAMIQTLKAAGYLTHEPTVKDRRLHILHLTDAGRARLATAEAVMDKAEALAFRGTSSAARERFADMLITIIEQGRALSATTSGPSDELMDKKTP